MIRGSLRGWGWGALAACLLVSGCGPTPTVKCQASNCSGCCQEDNTCVGATKQSFNACGSGGAKCRTCLPQQICSGLRCIAGAEGGGAGGGEATGGGSGGASGGGSGGGGAACGASGQPCCSGACLLGLSCAGNVCGTGGAGGGSGGGTAGGSGGGTAGGSGGGSAGGSGGGAAGGAGGGGAALGALGDPCVVPSNCASNYCQAFGFQDGYCTKTCTTQADCPVGVCGRNPSGGNVCLKSCTTAGTAPGGCRTGYVCEKFQSSLDGSPVCFPACASPSTCAGGALTCDSRGFCCGVNGAACCENNSCDNGGTCDLATRHCKVLPATNRPAGEACTTASNCAGNICIAELANSPPACQQPCFAGGFCTQDCTSSGCPAGSSCSLYTFPGVKRCVSNCSWDGGQGDCRSNYVCDRYTVAGSPQATCYKKCFHDAGCSTTSACDPSNGFCCGAQGFRCCSGAVKCPNGGSCNALDYCQ